MATRDSQQPPSNCFRWNAMRCSNELFNKFVKLNWLAEPELSPLFNVLSLFSSGSSSLKVNKNFRIIFHPSQTELIHNKPNSTTPNQTHPYQTKLNYTKLNSSIPNRTQPHQTKLIHTKPNSTTPNQTHPYQTELNYTKLNSSIPNRTQPYQTKLIHAKPNSTTPN